MGEGEREGDLDRRRVGVVCALAAVDIVDRVKVLVFALGVTVELQPDVGDDLVGVHVGRCACTALHHADDELVVEAAVDDELAGAVDEVDLVRVEHADLEVGTCGRLLDARERDDEIGVDRDRPLGDLEVLEGTRGVDAPVGVCGDLAGAEGVALDAYGPVVRCRGGNV